MTTSEKITAISIEINEKTANGDITNDDEVFLIENLQTEIEYYSMNHVRLDKMMICIKRYELLDAALNELLQ